MSFYNFFIQKMKDINNTVVFAEDVSFRGGHCCSKMNYLK